ncbi:MAG: VWA domain-containing protein, partial [Lachnospiraceae bacterium]|nr:VWA domain-containing protein [Lachnospiraceae bacterium]
MKGFKLFQRDKRKRLIALTLSAVMILGGMPTVPAYAADSGTPVPGTIVTVADPETLHRPIDIYGQDTFNAGKITVGKSVSTTGFENDTLDGVSMGGLTPDTNNFLVTLSQSAQATGLSSKLPVPVDAVFVLDTSGSMADPSNDPRYKNMISAANDAISALLAANDQNRVAVVAFSDEDSGYGTSDGAAANILSDLAHYDGEAATAHLQRVNSEGEASDNGTYVAGRKVETITTTERQRVQVGTDRWGRPEYEWQDVEVTSTLNAYRKAQEGGTNIQAGIALGASLLMDSTKETTAIVNGKTVTRIPFIVVLSDGNPTYSSTTAEWYDASAISEAGQ